LRLPIATVSNSVPDNVAPRPLRIEILGARHDRSSFSCGNDDLDRYFRAVAGQDTRRRLSAVFVLTDEVNSVVAGFYTLSACRVEPTSLPPKLARQLPRRQLPATLIGRLAVDLRYRGQGLGGFLLIDALVRATRGSQEIGAMAIVVDAKDDSARSFYERYGCQRFRDNEYRLFIPMSDAERTVSRALGEQPGSLRRPQ
jgi:GNAT superfamily N-acetyltransferase